MKIGLIPVNMGLSGPDDMIELATQAEAAGVESVWTFEHVVIPIEYESKYPYSPNGKMGEPRATAKAISGKNPPLTSSSSRAVSSLIAGFGMRSSILLAVIVFIVRTPSPDCKYRLRGFHTPLCETCSRQYLPQVDKTISFPVFPEQGAPVRRIVPLLDGLLWLQLRYSSPA